MNTEAKQSQNDDVKSTHDTVSDASDGAIKERRTKIVDQLMQTLDSHPDGFVFSSSMFDVATGIGAQDSTFNAFYHRLQKQGYGMYVVPPKPMKQNKSTYYPRKLPDTIRIKRLSIVYDPDDPEKRLAIRGATEQIRDLMVNIVSQEELLQEAQRKDMPKGATDMLEIGKELARQAMEDLRSCFDD